LESWRFIPSFRGRAHRDAVRRTASGLGQGSHHSSHRDGWITGRIGSRRGAGLRSLHGSCRCGQPSHWVLSRDRKQLDRDPAIVPTAPWMAEKEPSGPLPSASPVPLPPPRRQVGAIVPLAAHQGGPRRVFDGIGLEHRRRGGRWWGDAGRGAPAGPFLGHPWSGRNKWWVAVELFAVPRKGPVGRSLPVSPRQRLPRCPSSEAISSVSM